ncbi:cenp-O kinetochore centromere component [Xylariaceae sp. FL0255]|nr:cenp-O kinetochore centromere component [Xylariaceae sp. FL0255]
MANRESLSPELTVADKLQEEIAKLKAHVASLKHDLKIQSATLMTANSTRQLLSSTSHPVGRPSLAAAKTKQKLLARLDQHDAHKQQCLYRACASITTFKIQDPDPNAVDGGRVLGLRFEIMSKARFVRPYYVMLNRPYTNNHWLRVHRHTVPPCVPLAGLAARYLPAPAKSKGVDDNDDTPTKQDLSRFARALRRELVRYHNRAAVIGDLKRAVGLGTKTAKKVVEDGDESEIMNTADLVDVSAADAEAKQISMQWRDGRSGRLVLNDDGEIVKMVVQGDNGQDRNTARQFLGGSVRVENVTVRLESR